MSVSSSPISTTVPWEMLQVRKKSLVGRHMSAAEYVDRAAWWSREMTRMRARGPGDTENAMRSLERDYGVDYWVVWRLRYRLQTIKDIGISVYVRIEAAYRAECETQRDKLAAQVERSRAAGLSSPLLDEAESLAGLLAPHASHQDNVEG